MPNQLHQCTEQKSFQKIFKSKSNTFPAIAIKMYVLWYNRHQTTEHDSASNNDIAQSELCNTDWLIKVYGTLDSKLVISETLSPNNLSASTEETKSNNANILQQHKDLITQYKHKISQVWLPLTTSGLETGLAPGVQVNGVPMHTPQQIISNKHTVILLSKCQVK